MTRILNCSGGRLDGTVEIGVHIIDRPTIHFSEFFDEPLIGHGVLGDFSITFDQINQRIGLRKKSGHGYLDKKAAQVASLSPGGDDLRTAFNNDKADVRLLLILSPS